MNALENSYNARLLSKAFEGFKNELRIYKERCQIEKKKEIIRERLIKLKIKSFIASMRKYSFLQSFVN